MSGFGIYNDGRFDDVLCNTASINTASISMISVTMSLGLPIEVSSIIPTNPAQKGYIAYDNLDGKIMYSNGTSWIPIGSGGTGGTVTSITAGAGLNGGTITTTGTISLPTLISPPGLTYTNATVTVDAQGRITAVSNGTGGGTVTSITAGAGLNGGTITSTGTISLPTLISPPGATYTNATVTVDAQGRITAVSNGSAGGLTIGSVDATPNANALTLTGSTLQANAASPTTQGVVYGITDQNNTSLGYQALLLDTLGSDSVAVGIYALQSNTGSYNVAVGGSSLVSNITGSSNTALGTNSFQNFTDGINNIGIGASVGSAFAMSESNNIVIGSDGVIGDNNTIRIGTQGTGVAQQNACFVAGISGVAGLSNQALVVIDTLSGQLGTGNGSPAIPATPTTYGTVYGVTNADSVALGFDSLLTSPSGTNSVAIGYNCLPVSTGVANVGVGRDCLSGITTGIQNIALGNGAGSSYTLSDSDNIAIGNPGNTPENDTIRIGELQTQCFIAGISGATVTNITVFMDPATGQLGQHFSSKRYKTDIETLPSELSSLIYKLKPVQFTYKVKPQDGKQIGLLAEDVYEVEPRLVELNSEGLPDFVRYHDLPILLLNEIKKLKEEIECLKTRINKFIPEQD